MTSTPVPPVKDPTVRYEAAKQGLTAAQNAFDAKSKEKPPLTGDGIADTPPFLRWMGEMAHLGGLAADAMIELAEARWDAGIGTLDARKSVIDGAENYRAQIKTTFGAGLRQVRQAVIDFEQEQQS